MARVRDSDIPRMVWAKEFNQDVQVQKSPAVIERQMLKHHESSLLLLDVAGSLSANNEDDVFLEKLNSLFDKKQQKWRSKHICLYSNLKARRNFGLSNFLYNRTNNY